MAKRERLPKSPLSYLKFVVLLENLSHRHLLRVLSVRCHPDAELLAKKLLLFLSL